MGATLDPVSPQVLISNLPASLQPSTTTFYLSPQQEAIQLQQAALMQTGKASFINGLSTDSASQPMLWYVEQTVPELGCAATGNAKCPTVTALIPQVYLPENFSALLAGGQILASNDLSLNFGSTATGRSILNTGSIASGGTLTEAVLERLKFTWHGIGALVNEFEKGFTGISFEFAAHGKPVSVTLWRADRTGIEVTSKMHDTDERAEYGTLEFAPSNRRVADEAFVSLSCDLGAQPFVEMLVLKDGDVVCESGFTIRGGNGSALFVVAGVYPYTLAVRVTGYMGPFDPAFPIERYERVPMN
ncbi:hypothetical protein UC34_22365 [Pandoraea vervacti]|uniref:Uncharacterized protein n=1 Tax=Pandoraea vervacti TaxID=656178 RepID=A0ABM5T251_9BURK|nr:hypothetical protein UC34_22365 [Pandoraea vervacti]